MNSKHQQVYLMMFLMLLVSFLAIIFTPKFKVISHAELQYFSDLIPNHFEDWTKIESNQLQADLTPRNEMGKSIDNPYDDVFMASYKNTQGDIVSLALAYGATQRQEVKIHRPELCYYAQGFIVNTLTDHNFKMKSLHNQSIVGKNMLVNNSRYFEAVSYWIRIGETYSQSPWQTRFYIIKKGLSGDVVDGVLVRASMAINNQDDAKKAFDTNQHFLKTLIKHIPKHAQELLIK